MKNTLKSGALVLFAFLSFGFKGNDIIELQGYFNARYSANFLKSTKNVKYVLPPGTKARIQESKAFSSGNYGLKVEVMTGSRKGQSVWVYYKSSDPAMKLYPSEDKMQEEKPVTRVEDASHVKTTQETEALRVPAAEDAAEIVNEAVKKGNEAVKASELPGGPCDDCKVANEYARDIAPPPIWGTPLPEPLGAPQAGQETPTLNPPKRTINPHGIRPVRCGSHPDSYDVCTFEGDTEPGRFKFMNRGPNAIVPGGGDRSRMREWSFDFEAGARQDLGFAISDMPNSTISQTQESYFILLPRKTLPHVRTQGNKHIVTLPTGETVVFDKNTKEVLGGVLSENGPITRGVRELDPAKISYKGSGVMIRVDRRGEEPRLQAKGLATVTKGSRTCRVPVKELWPDQSQRSAVHFKYFSDSDADAYLKRKCGFGFQ
ncbi:hypothetical protein [Bdellovibrio bacteriovorus]|uniref:hypothetical protein n=1 Tax=Bdellovibrio bacteriovorus TaxID=959 RepID=UPI0035A742B9